jgi:undecaprenyl-diphosphatase
VLDYLNAVDTSVFRFLNNSLSNPVFDILMPFLTDLNKQRIVLVVVLTLILWMIIRGNRSVRLAAILLIVTIIISDQLSSSVIKYWLLRDRPCFALQDVRLLVSCGSGYSFPSSHAVNNFAGALILSFFLPRTKLWFFGFAATVAFSRIYVGVHYPFDVIGGGVIGLMCGGCVLFVFLGLEKFWYRTAQRKLQKGSS